MAASNRNLKALPHLVERVHRSPISQERLAVHLGIETTQFSRMIRGLRTMPIDLEDRANFALDCLEKAEMAAQAAAEEARQRSLAEMDTSAGKT